jgi:hypothetical protein
LSLGFENFAALIEKNHFKISNFRWDRKKNNFGKVLLYEVLFPSVELLLKKIIHIEDGLWSLGRFLQKTAHKKKITPFQA